MNRMSFRPALLCLALLGLNANAALTPEQTATLDKLHQHVSQHTQSYSLVESLTTEVGHRMAGSEGDRKAVAWAMDMMQGLGFDKVWKEPFEVHPWTRGDLSIQISGPYPHTLEGLALGGSVGTDGNTLNAEVVYFPDFAALKDARPGSLDGKIAYVGFRMSRHKDGHGYGEAVGARGAGASVAAEKGAIAFVLRSVGTDNNRHGHTGMMRYQDGVARIPAVAISNPDADLLENQLKRGQPVQLSLNVGAKRHDDQSVTSYNVMGEITGSEFPEQIIALGAHLDSWDVGTGAVDDGLGVGMTISAAHQVASFTGRPKRTIRVILFGAEEVGLLGARAYVAAHKDELANHQMGFEWDFGNGNIYQMTPGVGPMALAHIQDFADYLAKLGISLSARNDAKGQSDMSALGYSGVPAVNFAPDGSDYFDWHHTPNDTLDKVDPEALKFNTSVFSLFTWFAANHPFDFRQ
ncbi:M20/M25/M40 family metallo-hydrolase [Bowmanella sp. JS7-9]|uniref:Carboxypeptidase Q n=1 Tax=Pseudobowmanella zhangzhouensis TaxID=1537679 RepID=A0ABW1XI31_9ALTE|nr:M20/M25/M40 family metallo-hydrolase [Bowmanella sp. JS7-9]TBX25777.1 hypothetical protein TK45_03605 [Bowmanella sp. JS7-9]